MANKQTQLLSCKTALSDGRELEVTTTDAGGEVMVYLRRPTKDLDTEFVIARTDKGTVLSGSTVGMTVKDGKTESRIRLTLETAVTIGEMVLALTKQLGTELAKKVVKPVVKPKAKPDSVQYNYWKPGDPLPERIPPGCEWQTQPARGIGVWNKETDTPDYWSSLVRRWPTVKTKAKKVSRGNG